MKEKEKNVDRGKLIYKTSKRPYDFRKFNTIRTYNNKNLLVKIYMAVKLL